MRAFTPVGAGIGLYLLAVLNMTVMDTIAKSLTQELPVVQVVWARYAGQTLLVTLLLLPRITRIVRTHHPWLQFLRSLFLLLATTLFFFAISRMELAEATALINVNPVLITLGAALFLGERIGMRRLFGILAALAGALIIIRPGTEVFSPSAFLALAGAVFYAGFALVTRFVGRGESVWTSLFYTALLGALVLSIAVVPVWQAPSGRALVLMIAIGGVAALGQFLLIRAFMLAEASVVAPFSYAGLLFATLWGILFFDEWPDAATIVGAAIIAAAGVYVWHRETRDARARREADISAT
ncbi:DMT family transporter [Maritimibacter sp. HL-12]|jgi:drug/metabolite transporter (DMT)-like permease|uniref:DMT family transporter n=1 Tax=Maritimibacter sp. HL-12 TaxID=1162418 RepID=UPI000A0F07BC|nr:DMT family transporter [Maritimibacter sp. HL-12]SMH29688.1 Threonine/homoserine efflux transporter RhtA [Maritimibacter sp. HL-12]